MGTHTHITPDYSEYKQTISSWIENFDNQGEILAHGNRNIIKIFNLEGKEINIKSFKVPHLINSLVYKYFRKSKARRSFEYAERLLKEGIGTPEPVAYYEFFSLLGLKKSYYICEHLQVDLTFRELIEVPNYPDYEVILRQFIYFTWQLHEKGVEFLDHSPGNTLIKKVGEGQYRFFLVDLNRMRFHKSMNFEQRMMNMAHLTPKKEMIALMSEEYAKLYDKDRKEIFDTLWSYTHSFQTKFHRKRRLKKKLKFWKKN